MNPAGADKTILCVGRLYCDLIFSGMPRLPSLGTEVFAGGAGLYPGGGAFITAAHLSKLGRPVALAAMLPGPPFQSAMADQMAAAAIDLSLCRALPDGADPQITAALLGDGDRAFVTRRSGPACPPLSSRVLQGMNVGHLHIGELSTLAEHPELIVIARDAGLTVSLDCAWDETMDPSGLSALIAQVDVFLPNEAEVGWLIEHGVTIPPTSLVVTKRGAGGSEAIQKGQHFKAPVEKVNVVDATGAGDAFNAGFLDAWLQGLMLPKCLTAGNRQGGFAVQGLGGCPDIKPRRETAEVEQTELVK